MNGGPSGFHNAPFTRAFSIGCAVLTVIFGIGGRSSSLGLSYQDIFKNFQLWKFFASVFAFSSTPELVFGLYLLYYFRVFERQIGSNKYSVFILFSVIVSMFLEVIALPLIKDLTTNALTSGPYSLIFSSFVPFFFGIPISLNIHIFGVSLTDKSFTYLAGLQLLFSSWKSSLLPGVCGVLAGSLYHLNVFCIRRVQFPEHVVSFLSRLSWSSGGSPHNLSSGNFIRSDPYPVHQANYPLPAPAAEPPQDLVAKLVAMGFDTNSARQALAASRNDVNMATNILLEAQSR